MISLFRNYLLVFAICAGLLSGCNSGNTTPDTKADSVESVPVKTEKVESDTVKTAPKQETAKAAEPAEADSDGKVGILVVDTKNYDFGKIEPGGLKYGSFTLTNKGEGKLEIDRVSAPCRCTIPELSKKVLAPGESVELKFTFNVGKGHGHVQKKINLTTKQPSKPSNMTLTFSADIRKVIDISPAKLDFGLDVNFDNNKEITIQSTDGSEFAITGYVSNGDCVSIEYDPAVKAKMHKVKAIANLDKLRAAPAGMLTIKTSHPKVNRVTVRYSTKMPFDAFPKTKRFVPATEAGRQAKIKVVSNFGEDFEIGEVTSKGGYLKVLDIRKSVDGYEVQIELDMEKAAELENKKKYVSDYLIIPIVGRPEDSLEVHCYGMVK